METERLYVHGYSEREALRLSDQAETLSSLIHRDVLYPPGLRVLEAGCGVGSQTVMLARQNPQVSFVSVDISADSLEEARARAAREGFRNVKFEQADLFELPYGPGSFDHVFLCFVLEHLPKPAEALRKLMRVLKAGGSITAVEGDHGSAFFHPDNSFSRRAIECLVTLQARGGGDALIGRRLYPLFVQAGLREVRVEPLVVYADASRPAMAEGFTKKTFAAMVEGVAKEVLAAGLMSPEEWRMGVEGLYRAAEPDGTFHYTFFKARGIKEL
ncbi:MAG TPA: methyltransferase domain-containing protein [Anaerohalosphaeraceae bacterium]|nr:methyltransferase domain-containing protein [Anaerohalosphaeraceae bacterium]